MVVQFMLRNNRMSFRIHMRHMLCLFEKRRGELIKNKVPSTVSIQANAFVLTFNLSNLQYKPRYPHVFSKIFKATLTF